MNDSININKINLRKICYNILYDFLENKKNLKITLNNHIKNIDSRNIYFIKKTVTGVIKNYYFLNEIIFLKSKDFKKIDNKTKSLILLGLYQILYIDSIPNYAAVSSIVELSKELKNKKFNFINGILRNIIRSEKFKFNDRINYSFPLWLYNLLLTEYGENETSKLMISLNSEPKLWVRYLNDKNNNFLSFLKSRNITYKIHPLIENYLEIQKLGTTTLSEILDFSNVFIQSPSSGLVVKLLDPLTNDKIIDGCSGPGGKLTHIHQLVKNNCTATEINIDSYNKIFQNLKRMSLPDLNIKKINFLEINDTFNKILLDVPCSGTGTLMKNPDIKIRRKINDYSFFNKTQKELLNHAKKILSNNGSIVYSTCSINRIENWDIIDDFLHINKNFSVDNAENYIPSKYVDPKGALKILPSIHNLEGMFAVKLIKNENIN